MTDASEASRHAIRQFYDALSASTNELVASHRPPDTRRGQMAILLDNIVEALAPLRDARVLDIGCGTGVLGLQIARHARQYVGIDLSPAAVDALQDRARAMGLTNVEARVADVLADDFAAAAPGSRSFDRVLMYTVINLAQTEEEGRRFMQGGLDSLAPGGRALVGSIPIEELRMTAPWRGAGGRGVGVARWVLRSHAGLPHTRAWKVRSLARRASDRLRPLAAGVADVPPHTPGQFVPLRRDMVEDWVRSTHPEMRWRWAVERIGAPMHASRADLIVEAPGSTTG
ncbi:MAG: class I SAM-dependent methyltransferase [Chloroflexi bacterium]|nr:MAG: class I SAM-dependent methyltransferase [Chloroflexota bacterium]